MAGLVLYACETAALTYSCLLSLTLALRRRRSSDAQPARTRAELTEKIRRQKMLDGLTWKGLAASMGTGISPVYATAALLGEMRLTKVAPRPASPSRTALETASQDKDTSALLFFSQPLRT